MHPRSQNLPCERTKYVRQSQRRRLHNGAATYSVVAATRASSATEFDCPLRPLLPILISSFFLATIDYVSAFSDNPLPLLPPPQKKTPRRQNGEKVVTVLEQAGGELVAVEKASIDEVYVDVTRAARALLKSLVGSFAEVVARGSAEGPVVSPAVAPEKASERQSSEFGLTEVGEKDDVGGERRSEMPSSEDDQNGSGEDVGDQGYRGRSLENEEENMAKKGRTVGDSDSGFGGRMLEGGDNVGDAGGRDRDSEIEATSKEGAGDSEIEATSKEGAVDSEDEGDLARKKELLEAWQGRGRWEEIGAGGWAAVFSEVIGTHVSCIDQEALRVSRIFRDREDDGGIRRSS